VSLLFLGIKAADLSETEQWCAKVDILWLTVGYLNMTINTTIWNPEPEIGINRCSQTWQNPGVDGSGSGFGPPRCCRSAFWMFQEPNWSVFQDRNLTTCRFPWLVANTTAATWRDPVRIYYHEVI
jgi:hypothetical protein